MTADFLSNPNFCSTRDVQAVDRVSGERYVIEKYRLLYSFRIGNRDISIPLILNVTKRSTINYTFTDFLRKLKKNPIQNQSLF